MTAMLVLGRILQSLGWVWLIVGFVGPMFGFRALSFFPGILLVFIARVLRAQAARNAPPEEVVSEPAPERILNTDRVQPPPQRAEPRQVPTTPDPIFRAPETVIPEKVTAETVTPERRAREMDAPAIDDKGGGAGKEGLFERLALAGSALDDDSTHPPDIDELAGDLSPKSSADMIAEARQRWGKRP